jgi:hypothetical protein
MGNVGIFDMKQIRAVPPSFDADVEPLLRPGPEPYPTAVETVVCRLADWLLIGGDAVLFNLVYPFNPIGSSASPIDARLLAICRLSSSVGHAASVLFRGRVQNAAGRR